MQMLGNSNLLDTNCLTVVGARRCTSYGRDVARDVVAHLARRGITIVTGMARGIDSLALETAIKVDGKVVGVLGYGLKYAKRSKKTSSLCKKIIDSGGLLISPFSSSQYPSKKSFVERNKYMVEISNGVFIVESTLYGGSMLSAEFAVEAGKQLFVVPGSIFSNASAGCNFLLKCGANFVSCSTDILDKLECD